METKHERVGDMYEFWLENSGCGYAFVTAKVEIRLIRINIKLKPAKAFQSGALLLVFRFWMSAMLLGH